MKYKITLLCFSVFLASTSCKKEVASKVIEFSEPVRVEILGYSGHSMEPFLSHDGNTLFFNNLNQTPENTNLHWATRVNETTFQYQGELSNANTAELEGVATMDAFNNFYFVSLRDYTSTLSSLFKAKYSNGALQDVANIEGVSKDKPRWVNFDVEITLDGNYLYFVDGKFNDKNIPSKADLVIAQKKGSGFERLKNSSDILKSVNTNGALEYAACLSSDQLELYFTRLKTPITSSSLSELFYATRNSTSEPFGTSVKIEKASGFVEAATISPNDKTIIYHKNENGTFVLYAITKTN